jgi:3-oxoacyl-[acyl-carrier protein] reductase
VTAEARDRGAEGQDDLSGRVALVTGGSGGLGSAICERLAAAGVAVAVGYGRSEEAAAAVVERIAAAGGRAAAVQGDAAIPEDCARIVDATEAALGPIDVLVPNAGVSRPQGLDDVGLEDWEHLMAVNLRAPFLLAQRVTPGMRERGWGRVLLMSSVGALRGSVLGPHYAASKAGLLGLTHDLAARLAGDGITVNALAPALVADTAMVQASADLMRDPPPVGRFGRSAEVADLALAVLANGYLTRSSASTAGSTRADWIQSMGRFGILRSAGRGRS